MGKPLVFSLLSLFLLHASFAQSTIQLPQHRLRARTSCQIQQLNAREPSQRFDHEAGSTELWENNNNNNNQELECAGVEFVRHTIQPKGLLLPHYTNSPQLVYIIQGSGIQGNVIPGCAETYESESRRSNPDRHQKLRRFRQGDIIALQSGITHWTYNDGDTPIISVAVRDVGNEANQLDSKFRDFFLAGKPQRDERSRGQEEERIGRRSVSRSTRRGEEQRVKRNILSGFETEFLAEAFNADPELISKIQGREGREDNRGAIVRAERLSLVFPEWSRQEQKLERQQSQQEQEREREQGRPGQHEREQERESRQEQEREQGRPSRREHEQEREARQEQEQERETRQEREQEREARQEREQEREARQEQEQERETRQEQEQEREARQEQEQEREARQEQEQERETRQEREQEREARQEQEQEREARQEQEREQGRPSRHEQEQEQGREEQEREEEHASNGLEETLCSYRIRENIDNPRKADVYNPRAGRITRLNSQKLPILNSLRLNADRGVLYKNAMMAPHWSMNAHTLIYVIRGSARIQVVGNQGNTVFDDEAREGQLLVVPQNFAIVKRANEQGFEWVSFRTNDNAMIEQLAGRLSAIRAMPEEVVMNAYGVSREEARSLKYNREETTLLSPGGSRSD